MDDKMEEEKTAQETVVNTVGEAVDKLKHTSVGTAVVGGLRKLYSNDLKHGFIFFKIFHFFLVVLLVFPAVEAKRISYGLFFIVCVFLSFLDTSLSCFSLMKPINVLVKISIFVSITKLLAVFFYLVIKACGINILFFMFSFVTIGCLLCFDFAFFCILETSLKLKAIGNELSSGDDINRTWVISA